MIDWEKLARGDYEAEQLNRLKTPCYDATSPNFSVLNAHSLFYRPVADIARLAKGTQQPAWPEGKRFAVCLTHDVDAVSRYALSHHARRLTTGGRLALREPNIRHVKNLLQTGWLLSRSLSALGKKDPTHCYEKWLQAEAEVGATSTFLFLPEQTRYPHATDGGYRFDDSIVFDGQKTSVREMMREMSRRGWEVGLHALWNSWRSADEMKYQKEQVERAADSEVVSLRQHCLHFDIRVSPEIYAQSGILFDTSVGFNDNVGFRFGTCYPWLLSEPNGERLRPTLELPLIIQDKALIECCAHNPSLALSLMELLISAVEEVGGVLTLLWHPCRIAQEHHFALYRHALGLLKNRNAYFGTMREIGTHWLNSLTD